MDPRSAPQRVAEAHVADQLTDFERDFWPAAARARLPSPEQAKTGSMPADDRLGLAPIDPRDGESARCRVSRVRDALLMQQAYETRKFRKVIE